MSSAALLQALKRGPQLVASLDGDDLPALLQEARRLSADIVEIRLDTWGPYLRHDMADKLKRFRDRIEIPMLISFRGGDPLPSWWQPMHWRAMMYASLIDVEWQPKYPWKEISAQAKVNNLATIVSHHDYKTTPSLSALNRIVAAAAKKADLVKIATHVRDEADIRVLNDLCLAQSRRQLTTVMGMGPWAALSRLVAPLFGASLVYGYIGKPTAKGQLPYKELQDKIRSLYPHYAAGLQERLGRRKVKL